MRYFWLSLCTLLSLCGCSSSSSVSVPFFSSLPAGVTLVEKSAPQTDKVGIPYSKYKLNNGLTVILAPDHSDPLVHVDVTYHVGSAREEVGKSGFAHFFEHMMFQGSKHVGDQQHFKIITAAGGTLNGTTNRDRTNYYETVPANQLEKVLWLESDRMGYLLDAVSQHKFEIQRATVKNERAQNFDNRPYGLMWEKMSEAMYPANHPYSWPTIGYVDDLNHVNVNDLKAFFLRWYGPNNAVLTIGGDIDKDQTLAWVSKYFGPIPKGPEVKSASKQPAVLQQDKFVTLEDRIRQPMVVIGWPTTYMGEQHQTDLDMLANVLGTGNNSYLYQHLVKNQKAVSAGAFHDCAELACNFYVYAMGQSGSKGDLKVLYKELQHTLHQFSQQGVNGDRLQQITGLARADAVFALQSVSGKVSQLASNETFFGKPDRIQQQLTALNAVTPQSVMDVYQQYIAQQHKVVLSVVPRGHSELAAHSATFVTPPRILPDYKTLTSAELHYHNVTDTFDRSVMPKAGPAVSAHIPKLYHLHFNNGSELIGTESNETPVVLMQFKLPGGNRFVPRGKEGLAQITAAMMTQGTTRLSAEQLQAELDKLGSDISFSASGYTTNVTVSMLKQNVMPTLALLQEMLQHPAFKQSDFARIQRQSIESALYQHQQPNWLAAQATRQVLFANTDFARASSGTEASLSGLTLNDVKSFYHQHYTPQGAQVVVVGDVSCSDVRKNLAFWQQWQGEVPPLYQPQVLPKLTQQKIYLVDLPGATQSTIRLVRQGMPFDVTGKYFLAQLANFNLAGNFNSRINQNLREDKGYTYGASGYLSSNQEVGSIVFQAPVKAQQTIPALIELKNELNEYSQAGMTDSEVDFMRQAIGQQDALSYETLGQKASLIANILRFSLDEDYLKQRNRIVEHISKQALNRIAHQWFDPDDYQIIIVGDAKTLRPQLEKFHKPIEELEIIR